MNNKHITHIVSIWPVREVATRTFLQPTSPEGSNIFVLEAATKEKPFVLAIEYFQQREYIGNDRHQNSTVWADEVAADLVNQLAMHKNGAVAGAGPGIWIDETLKNGTIAEVHQSPLFADAVKRQDAFAWEFVTQARAAFFAKKYKQITKLHYTMAALLGIQNEPWQQDGLMGREGMKACPFCASALPLAALICQNCTRVIDPQGVKAMEEKLGIGAVINPNVISQAKATSGATQ